MLAKWKQPSLCAAHNGVTLSLRWACCKPSYHCRFTNLLMVCPFQVEILEPTLSDICRPPLRGQCFHGRPSKWQVAVRHQFLRGGRMRLLLKTCCFGISTTCAVFYYAWFLTCPHRTLGSNSSLPFAPHLCYTMRGKSLLLLVAHNE